MSFYSHVTKAFRLLPGHGKRNISRNYSNSNNKKLTTSTSEIGKTVYQTLKGRDLLTFDGYTRNDILSLLWIATEIKLTKKEQLAHRGKRICLIWSNPIIKASISHASQRLKASLCSVHEDQLEKSSNNLEMLGRCMGAATDIIFVNSPSWNQYAVERFATGCTCPVVVISSEEYTPALAYAEMFTLFEKYGFLRRLIITCISVPENCIMLNTYFTLLPTIGMHLRYLQYGQLANLSSWEKGIKLSSRNNTEIKQFESISDALYRSHCLSTCLDNSSTPSSYTLQINLKSIKEMDLDWTLLQHDAHKGLSVSEDLMKATNHNLIFKAIENQSWIFQALILAHASDYAPDIPPPRFEGVD